MQFSVFFGGGKSPQHWYIKHLVPKPLMLKLTHTFPVAQRALTVDPGFHHILWMCD